MRIEAALALVPIQRSRKFGEKVALPKMDHVGIFNDWLKE
jgi:hypothetical protein